MNTLPILAIDNPVECTIIGRLNRFVVEVESGGLRRRASTNNTGRLLDFIVPGKQAFCVRHARASKTDYSLFAIEDSGAGALIDTQLQMRAFENALACGHIPWLEGYCTVKRNPQLGDSVTDYLLESKGGKAYLEVKSAVLRDGEYAMYPDCPTARGRRHIRDLTDYARSGGKAFILFVAALPGVVAFKPNKQADPELHELLLTARQCGAILKALNIIYAPKDSAVFLVNADLPVELRV